MNAVQTIVPPSAGGPLAGTPTTGRPGLAGVDQFATAVDAADDARYTVEKVSRDGRQLLLVTLSAVDRDALVTAAAGEFACRAARRLNYKVLGLNEMPKPYPSDQAMGVAKSPRFQSEFRVVLDL